MIRRISDLLEALTMADIEAAAPAARRRFAQLCLHWASKADPPPEGLQPTRMEHAHPEGYYAVDGYALRDGLRVALGRSDDD